MPGKLVVEAVGAVATEVTDIIKHDPLGLLRVLRSIFFGRVTQASFIEIVVDNQSSRKLTRGRCYPLRGRMDGSMKDSIYPQDKAIMKLEKLNLGFFGVSGSILYFYDDTRGQEKQLIITFSVPLRGYNECGLALLYEIKLNDKEKKKLADRNDMYVHLQNGKIQKKMKDFSVSKKKCHSCLTVQDGIISVHCDMTGRVCSTLIVTVK